MKNSLKTIAVIGLALGGALGILGTIVTSQTVRAISWGIDGTALVVAASILALTYFRKGNDCIASGFLVYAIGEAVMLGGTAASLQASIAPFAAGTALWSAGLFLTSIPREFILWTRISGLIAAALFAITSAGIFLGHPATPISRPLPFFAYPFLVLTFIGWIYTILKRTN